VRYGLGFSALWADVSCSAASTFPNSDWQPATTKFDHKGPDIISEYRNCRSIVSPADGIMWSVLSMRCWMYASSSYSGKSFMNVCFSFLVIYSLCHHEVRLNRWATGRSQSVCQLHLMNQYPECESLLRLLAGWSYRVIAGGSDT
jgi:hypothetical protein